MSFRNSSFTPLDGVKHPEEWIWIFSSNMGGSKHGYVPILMDYPMLPPSNIHKQEHAPSI